jgi:hypothetical protein
MGRKTRYTLVFALALIVANVYTFWPAFEYGNQIIPCPSIFASKSFEIVGPTQLFGRPLFSEEQFVMAPGTTAYEIETYNSSETRNNLTSILQNPSGTNPSPNYLYQLDSFSGQVSQTPINQTGIVITFQNMTFQGIYFAKLVYKISVSSSANSASYELSFPICGDTGLIMTVGSLLYAGPLDYGEIQLAGIIINNAVALVAAALICVFLRFYWSRGKKIWVVQSSHTYVESHLENLATSTDEKFLCRECRWSK